MSPLNVSQNVIMISPGENMRNDNYSGGVVDMALNNSLYNSINNNIFNTEINLKQSLFKKKFTIYEKR